MSPFVGFPAGKVRFTAIPSQFFSDLLPEIDHLGELKVSLYALWLLDRMEGNLRYLRYQDFTADQRLMNSLGRTPEAAIEALNDALERVTQRGLLLCARSGEEIAHTVYFLNSPRGRAALQSLVNGEWAPEANEDRPTLTLDMERPNIYRLYEEHIGALTPLIAEDLRAAEQEYSPDWIEDAIHIAAKNNIRNWRYVDAILRSWKEKGRHEQNRRDSEENRRRYIEGEFGQYVQH